MKKRPDLPLHEHCTYCGAWADTWDHVIPLAAQGVVRKGHDWSAQWIVPACSSCNGMLSDKLFHSIPAKAAYLASAYMRKFKKLITSPKWTDAEIAELSGNLRKKIVECEQARAEVNLRIATARVVAAQDDGYRRPANPAA